MTPEELGEKWGELSVRELNILAAALRFGLAAGKTKYDSSWDDAVARQIAQELSQMLLFRCHPRG